MRTQVDAELSREAVDFQLRFTCEHCAHFDEGGPRCAHGYPISAHFGTDLDIAEAIEFCKEFELF